MTVCDQVRKLLLHLLLWKPTVVVSGTWDWSSLLSRHVIHTGELGEAEKVGERSRHKGGSRDSSLGRFLLAGVFKAGVGCNKNLGFTFRFLTWLGCNSSGTSLQLIVFLSSVKRSLVFLPVPAEREGQIPISFNSCNAALTDFSWESCKTSLLARLLCVLWDAVQWP